MIFSKIQLLLLVASCTLGVTLAKSIRAQLHQTARSLVHDHLAELAKLAKSQSHQLRTRAQSHNDNAASVVSALSSYDYLTIYTFTSDDCAGDSAVAASTMATDCISMSFSGFSVSAKPSCTDSDGYTMDVFLGNNCKSSDYFNTTTLFPPTMMNTCSDDSDDDSVALYAMYKCSNNVQYGLDEGPAVGLYIGDSCSDTRFVTTYYKDSECETVGADSISSACSDTSLELTSYYGTTTCSGATSTETDSYTTNECVAQTSDDDYYYYDDDSSFTGSYYAACSADDLPDSAFQHVVSAWALVMALVAGVAVLRN